MITMEQAMMALGYPTPGHANETEEPACEHDVGVFVGYDQETGEQMWKCTQCGNVSVD